MKQPIHPLLARLLPFLMIIVFIAVFVLGIFLFSYILIFALVVGGISFLIAFFKGKLGKKKPIHTTTTQSSGRLIEHDEG